MSDRPFIPATCLPVTESYTLEQAFRSVGLGWHPLVEKGYAVVRAAGANVIQVKEKFGTLAIYPAFPDDDPDPLTRDQSRAREVADLLAAIEQESARTCERCGAPGDLVTVAGWRKTLCPPHAAAYEQSDGDLSWDPGSIDYPGNRRPRAP